MSRWRRLAYTAILVAFAAFLCELVSCAVYRVAAKRWFRYGEVAGRKEEARSGAPAEPALRNAVPPPEVLHPYLGYVADPTHPDTRGTTHAYGFRGIESALDPSADAVVVGIFGGSVAQQVGDLGAAVLVEELARIPAFAGRPIRIASAALAGYKQPQQLYAYEYLWLMGGRFDVVLNLDGFNDVVLPAAENLQADVFFAYPRRWSARTAALTDVEVMRASGTVMLLRDQRASHAEWLSGPVLDRLVTPSVLWYLLDVRLTQRLWEEQVALRAGEEPSYLREGPLGPTTREECFRDSAQVWARASLAMDALADRNGARYFHFLQPNQYVAGSKPLSDEERKHAIDLTGGAYGPTARDGYPSLIAAGRELPGRGVEYHDLTAIFASEPGTLYVDTCCHLNEIGIRTLARHMGAIVRDRLAP